MKKKKFSLLTAAIICLLSTNVYAADLGKLEKVEDKLIPNGKNAIISQKITAVTNDKGQVAFSLYKKSEIVKVEATKGNIVEKVQKVENGDQKYNVIVFDEKKSEVSFEVTINKEGGYEGKSAKLGDTYPGGVSTVEYKVANTSPNAIKAYSAQIAVPKGKELLNIVDYDPEKAFSIVEKDGYVFGGFNFESIDAGKETKLAINILEPKKTYAIVVWAAAAILSIAFMIKNKHLLKKA